MRTDFDEYSKERTIAMAPVLRRSKVANARSMADNSSGRPSLNIAGAQLVEDGSSNLSVMHTKQPAKFANGGNLNKENFEPTIAERIKQTRRSSTKPSASSPRPQPKPPSELQDDHAAMAVEPPTNPLKREPPIDTPQVPSSKRPRCFSDEAQPRRQLCTPYKDQPNLAGLLLSQVLEFDSRRRFSPAAFQPDVVDMQPVEANTASTIKSPGALQLSRPVTYPGVNISSTCQAASPLLLATNEPSTGVPNAHDQRPRRPTSRPNPLTQFSAPPATSTNPLIAFSDPPACERNHPVQSFRHVSDPEHNKARLSESNAPAPATKQIASAKVARYPLQQFESSISACPSETVAGNTPTYPPPLQQPSPPGEPVEQASPQDLPESEITNDTQIVDNNTLALNLKRQFSSEELADTTSPFATRAGDILDSADTSDTIAVSPAEQLPSPTDEPTDPSTLLEPAVCDTSSKVNTVEPTAGSSYTMQPSPPVRPELPTPTSPFDAQLSSKEDKDFIDQVKRAIKAQSQRKAADVSRRSAYRIHQLLELGRPPTSSEAVFLSGEEAAHQFEPNVSFPGIIITENQQPLPLQNITQFLNEYYDDTAKVFIQDPTILISKDIAHVREISIGELKKRFLNPNVRFLPWNCLELAAHVEDGIRPAFLNNEDCRLLTKLKIPSSNDRADRRGFNPGWKEVEKWALLAQGGALTEPHQDSHGYSTYITMNQGTMGFGWLANPTVEDKKQWCTDPGRFSSDKWRYIVLKPGQTIFFPSGTVHFVFRLQSRGDTLAFGGHVLRCSQIVNWVKTMLEEQAAPEITNEDLTVSAAAYLDRVEKFVKQAQKTGQVDKWGGAEAIQEFLKLKGEFVKKSK